MLFAEEMCSSTNRHRPNRPPVQLYATQSGTKRNLRAMRDAGFRLLTSPPYLAEHGWKSPPWAYCLDNGAWSSHRQGRAFDGDAFARAVDTVGLAADWLVLPDIVAGGLASLELSLSWSERLHGHPTPRMLVVQDGMGLDDVQRVLTDNSITGLFVGGSTPWKRSTMRAWGGLAAETGRQLHVGRVNSARLIREVLAIGAEAGIPVSCDGTSVSIFAVTAPKLGRAAEAGAQVLMGFDTATAALGST